MGVSLGASPPVGELVGILYIVNYIYREYNEYNEYNE